MKKHCCKLMIKALTFDCNRCADHFACPDVLIQYIDRFDEYGIIIHDGGSSVITIHFCPWCGTKLPESKRDLWFDTLESMGYDNPAEEDIPRDFKTGEWIKIISDEQHTKESKK